MKIDELKFISENLIDTFNVAGKESMDLYARGLKIEIKEALLIESRLLKVDL